MAPSWRHASACSLTRLPLRQLLKHLPKIFVPPSVSQYYGLLQIVVCLSSYALIGLTGVLIGDPTPEDAAQFGVELEGMEIKIFVLLGPPQLFDKDSVYPVAAPVHIDANPGILQHAGETGLTS
jgi:hypothetical protein